MTLSNDFQTGTWIGRVLTASGPHVVTVRNGDLIDITCKDAPTVRDVLERDDAASYVQNANGDAIAGDLLAPCDLQSIKASGVTFARSMVERVIEERAGGDPAKAEDIRARVKAVIGDSLSNIVPGSETAEQVKQALIKEDMWSQYLEVGIGPDVEVFSKAQTLSSVGHGAEVGLHPMSSWNNPEPEVVLAVNSRGSIQGATLGNDVNLRDVEGRSALLLSKAKDNNASCSIGPMIRLFDETYTLDDVRNAELTMKIEGEDGYVLNGASSMKEISRDPEDIVRQTIGLHHQYPDGFMLFLGTLFAPTEDRDVPGEGFTHKIGDIVTIECEGLGALVNKVNLSTECPKWKFGIADLMRNLAGRDLL